MSEASPQWSCGWNCRSYPYASMCVPYVESRVQGFTDLTYLPKICLIRKMMKKTAAYSKAKGKKQDLHADCLVNSYQVKDAGVPLRLNNSIHRNTGFGVIKVIDSRNYFQYCRGKHSSM